MKSAKTNLAKRRNGEYTWVFYTWIFSLIVGSLIVFVLLWTTREVKAQLLVPADDIILSTTGTNTYNPNNPFGVSNNLGTKRIAQTIPTSTSDRAVCGIDALLRILPFTEPTATNIVKMAIYKGSLSAPDQIVEHSYPTTLKGDLTLSFATTTWIFDPCYTLQANQQYFAVASVDPLYYPGNDVYLKMLNNSSTVAYMEEWDGSNYDWYTYSEWGYPLDMTWVTIIYGFSNLSGFDEPVSDDYLFSTSTITGEDLGKTGNFLSDIAKYLFLPSDSIRFSIEQKREELNDKVPFAYFSDVSEVFTSVTSTGSSSTLITIKTSMGDVDLWDTSSTKNSTLWTGLRDPIFLWIRVFLWGSFAFWVFYRVRDLTL